MFSDVFSMAIFPRKEILQLTQNLSLPYMITIGKCIASLTLVKALVILECPLLLIRLAGWKVCLFNLSFALNYTHGLISLGSFLLLCRSSVYMFHVIYWLCYAIPFVPGIGYDLLVDMLKYISPTHVVKICISAESKNLPAGAFWLDEGQDATGMLIEVNSARQDYLKRSYVLQCFHVCSELDFVCDGLILQTML